MKIGEPFTLVCKANRTAGYTLIPDFNKEFISLTGQKFESASPQMLGNAGKYFFMFKVLKYGSDHLKILTKSAQEEDIVNSKDYFITVE